MNYIFSESNQKWKRRSNKNRKRLERYSDDEFQSKRKKTLTDKRIRGFDKYNQED